MADTDIDEVDHRPEANPVDQVTDRTTEDQAERDLIPRPQLGDLATEDDDCERRGRGHDDEPRALSAEQSERGPSVGRPREPDDRPKEIDRPTVARFIQELDKPMPEDERILWPDNKKFFNILQEQLDTLDTPVTLDLS